MRCLVILLCSAFAGKYFIFANSTFVNEVNHNDKMIAKQNEIILTLKNKADLMVSSIKSRNQIDLTEALEKISSYKTQQNRMNYVDVTSSKHSQNARNTAEKTLEEHEVEDSLILEINSMATSYIPRWGLIFFFLFEHNYAVLVIVYCFHNSTSLQIVANSAPLFYPQGNHNKACANSLSEEEALGSERHCDLGDCAKRRETGETNGHQAPQ